MPKKSSKKSFVALNISLPESQKAHALEQMNLRGYATLSEYIRDLIRKDCQLGLSSQPNILIDANKYADSVDQIRGSLELFELAKTMYLARLEQTHPELSQQEKNLMLTNWVRNKPNAPYGDAEGEPNFQRLNQIINSTNR